jgi:crotonobetainyl-CoA:carnitine CoA-transferase CaiB-like acyl-CoA transferase
LAREPIELVGSPFHLHGAEQPTPRMPSRLGEHTDEILRAVLGLDAEHIAQLRARKIV